MPRLGTLAVLANARSANAGLEMEEAQAAARSLGLDVIMSQVAVADDIAHAIEALKGRADAIYTCSDPLLTTNRIRVNALASGARLPTMHGFREYVEAGGLTSYGPNFPDLFRRAAELVDKIFVPFFSTKKNGSGIGLSLCKQIMMIHKGTIQVQSVENEGTVFYLKF